MTVPVFLALFFAVIAFLLGEEVEESFCGAGGSYSTVLLEAFRMCDTRLERCTLARIAAICFGGEALI